MNNQIVVGSIGAIAKAEGKSLAESFIHADAVVIVDTSGSMETHDSKGGKSRYDVAVDELRTLQNHLPGKIAVVAFSDNVEFCPAGIPTLFGSGTDLLKALRFVKVADVPDMKFILISDGEPGEEDKCLQMAATFTNHIDVIYCGPEDHPTGRNFLEKLARATGGKSVTADRAMELSTGIAGLLNKGY